MPVRAVPWLDYWLQALGEPIGLYLRVANRSDQLRLKSSLYSSRVQAPSHIREAIAHLEVRVSVREPDTTLWIIPRPGG